MDAHASALHAARAHQALRRTAVAALGSAAIDALRPLLDDQRSAPAHGSQDATLSRANANRVCDFAWVLIKEARGEEYAYATAPADRDREIAGLKAALAAP